MNISIVVLLGAFIITGCQGQKTKSVGDTKKDTIEMKYIQAAYHMQEGGADLGLCKKELDALKKINPVVWEKYRIKFNRLMGRAGLYVSVRGELNPYTQGAMDSYYRFNADKLCSDLIANVLDELSEEYSLQTVAVAAN